MSYSIKFSARASLIELGNYLENTVMQQMIEQEDNIKQQVPKHTPTENQMHGSVCWQTHRVWWRTEFGGIEHLGLSR